MNLGSRIIDAVREVAAGDPDYIYRRGPRGACVYVLDGQPDCIIGRAMWALDLIGPDLEHMSSNSRGIVHLLKEYRSTLDVTPEQLNWLAGVQSYQDCGIAWGEAVDRVDRGLPL